MDNSVRHVLKVIEENEIKNKKKPRDVISRKSTGEKVKFKVLSKLNFMYFFF